MTKSWHEDFEDEPGCEEDGFYFEEPTYEQLTGEPEIESDDPGEIRCKFVENYSIVGNKNYAFACNMNDATDKHYFTRDPDVNDDAFIRACGWAYEPTDLDLAIKALKQVQKALAAYRDSEQYVHPLHGKLSLEEVKYCIVDSTLERLNQ